MDLTAYRESPAEQARFRDLMESIPKGLATALDIGARDGHFSKALTQHFEHVTALDLEKPSFTFDRVTPVQGDITGLQFPDRAFDVVLCAEVLEHINPAQLPKACSEIVRVTRHAAVIGVPYNQDLRVGRTTCAACGGINPPWAHLNIFDEKNLTTLFRPLRASKPTYCGTASPRTNALAAMLLDAGGNPWGSYNQEEPCVHCGRKIVPPERTLFRKICSALGVRFYRLQGKLSSPKPMWIHMVFIRDEKASPA